MSKQINSLQDEVLSPAAPKKSYNNLYSDNLCAELLELQSDTEILFKQLQSLSRQSLDLATSQAGSGN